MNLIIMNLILIVFAYLCCRAMACATAPLNFNAFLEKAKLKDDGSNYMDWVRNLRIILIAAQKNYVLEALLGAMLQMQLTMLRTSGRAKLMTT